jgi:RHS repeat-associated protein
MRTVQRLVCAIALVATIPAVPSAVADPGGWQAAAAELAKRAGGPQSPPVTPSRSAPSAHSDPVPVPKAAVLPEPTSTRLTLAQPGIAARAGRSPVQLAARDARGAGRPVRVDILDAGAAARAGVSGFVFQVSAEETGPLEVSVDYAAFAERFGAGYADRLGIVSLPDGTRLRARNERDKSRLVAEIDPGKATTFAVTAGPEGEEGSFKATSLALSGDWQVNPGSGNFSFNYEIPLAKAPAGPTPELGLHYSSGAVDGLVSGRNTQSGQVGLGWADFTDAFIERRYNSCQNDGQGSGDLCWKSDNATISLNGKSGELVPLPNSSPKQWRLRDDPRWRVEQLTGAGNGDNDGEYWIVTTPDGVRYFFGRGINPDVGVETNSVWTVPVIGDDPGEPCGTVTPVAWCPQAWRWNLDLVIDPHDNVQQYEYQKEINYYAALNGWPGFEHTEYVRSGALVRIKYGKRRVGSETIPSAKVEFDSSYRCVALDDSCAAPTAATAASYPDTPVDLMCLTATCSQHSPTFFTALRYTTITAQVNDGDGDGPFVDVDKIRLYHGFPDPDPNRAGDQKLYLNSLQRTGLTAKDAITLPPVTFFPVLLNNRVDTASGLSAMPHFRVGVVTNEYGGQVHITYGRPHPCPDPIPNPPNWDLNTRDCFPQWHTPDGGAAGFAIFHKYLVTAIEERDPLGGSPSVTTTYRYGDQVGAGLPNAAWHHDRDEFAPNSVQSWSEWRGYADVIVAQGDTRTQYRFFRGMNSDRLAGDPFPGPGSRVAKVSSLDGTVTNLNDENWLAGQTLDQQSLRTNGTVEAGMLTGYHTQRTIDVTTSPDPLDDAWFVAPNDQIERRRNPADGSYVRRRTQTVYNGLLGTVDKVIEHGWTNVSGDERCTVTAPTFNANLWMLDLPGSTTRYGNATCDGPEFTREEFAYDGGAFGAGPTSRADQTGKRTKLTAAPTWATTTTTYDRLGRPLVVTDPNGHTTTTSYTPDIRYPRITTETNHLGHVKTTEWLRPRQAAAAQNDARGKRTTMAYDALGRMVSVHQSTEQAAGAPASYEFGYLIDPDKAALPVVRTRRLQDSAGGSPRYVDAWIVHDTFLRARQTHTLSPEAGKIIVTDTGYDNRALAGTTSTPQAIAGSPGLGIVPTPQGGWANDTLTLYDELKRPVWEITRVAGAYRRSVVTEYTHDTTKATPDPAAGGVVRTVKDAFDRVIRVEELDAGTWRSTSYGYDPADRMTTVRDPAGNTITNTYDLAGRKIAMADPDGGSSTYGYDAVGNQTRTTSAAGVQLHTTFDALNRKTERHKDSPTGPLLDKWEYDAAGERGLLDKSTRFETSGSWVVDVTGYDDRARPTGKTWTVPASITGLAGSYSVGYGYDASDHQTSVRYPAVGGLPAETVTSTYNSVGLPDTLTGAEEYIWGSLYDDRARPVWLLSGSRSTPFSQTYAYDADQRVARLSAGGGTTVLQDIHFTYDPTFGNIADRDTVLNGQASRECYTYDDRQRMTRAFTTTGSCATGSPGTGANAYNHSYQYSVDGNLTKRIEGATTINYGYPAAGAARPHAPTSVGSNTYTWTPNGELASRTVGGQTETLTWDAERHLAQVGGATFVYDAAGDRLLRQTSTGTTLYLDGHEITKPSNGSTTAVRTYGRAGTPVATRTPAGVEYLALDNQGSVQLTVPSGATAPSKVRAYQPYGRPRTTDITTTDHGWIGQIEDRSTGLDYLNARYYDATIGRFIAPDPMFDTNKPQSINPYAYGLNNPVAFTDPSGLIPEECRNGQIQCQNTGKGWTFHAKPPPPPPNPCAPGQPFYGHAPCWYPNGGGPKYDPASGATVITSTDGPALSPDEIDEILKKANEIRYLDPDKFANIGAGGGCAEGKISWGVTIGVGLCITWDGEKFALLGMAEAGSGAPFAGVGAGGVVTNAESSDDLLGNAWCVNGGGGAGWASSAEICINYSDDWERPTGVWTVGGSTGPGVGADMHIVAVKTKQLAALSPGDIPDAINSAGEWINKPIEAGEEWVGDKLHSLVCFGRC